VTKPGVGAVTTQFSEAQVHENLAFGRFLETQVHKNMEEERHRS